MKRYYYSSDLLVEEELKAAFNFSKSLLANDKKLYIFLNLKKNAQELLTGVFNAATINKLRHANDVKVDGVSVFLDSKSTFDKFKNYGVVLVIHGSNDLLKTLETSGKIDHLVVCNNEIDIPVEWLKNDHEKLQGRK